MPNRVPTSYDEITRKTVPNPDSSWRPSPEQVRQAYEGFRALDVDEQALFDRIDDALSTCGHDVQEVEVEVERENVTLHGTVSDATALRRVVDCVRGVEGVRQVNDRLTIEAD